MSAKVNKFVRESFTNNIGQTLNPGDNVVFVTTGYGHRVAIESGKFEGVYRNLETNKLAGTRITDVPVKQNVIEYAEDGKHEETTYKGWDKVNFKSIYEKTGKRYNLVPKVTYRKSALQLNRVFKIDTAATDIVI